MLEPFIIFEDRQILVVKKPYGWLAQADGKNRPDVLTWSKQYLVTTLNKPGRAFVGLCHRLDRLVGGVMILAKTSKAASRLSQQFREHSTQKIYRALCLGWPKKSGQLEDSLVRAGDLTRTAYPGEKGTRAVLSFKILKTGYIDQNKAALLEVELLTGFKHQIRAQLASINCPIWGDIRYGGLRPPKDVLSIGLWSSELVINHPISQEQLRFKAEPGAIWPFSLEIEVSNDS